MKSRHPKIVQIDIERKKRKRAAVWDRMRPDVQELLTEMRQEFGPFVLVIHKQDGEVFWP